MNERVREALEAIIETAQGEEWDTDQAWNFVLGQAETALAVLDDEGDGSTKGEKR